MSNKLDLSSLNLAEKQLLSEAFDTFNRSLEKLRGYQAKLQAQVTTLSNEVQAKNQELSNVLQSLKSGLIVTDLQGHIQTFNRAAVQITGLSKEQAIGKEINLLLGQPFLPTPLNQETLSDLANQKPQEIEHLHPEGHKILLEVSTTLIESEESKTEGVILNLTDISLLKRLQNEAERKNRLAAMGEISMQVAHEVRNPLGSIELFVSMMKKDFAEDSGESELLNHITSAIHSMNHIISNLLEYSRPKPINLEPLDLTPLLKDFTDFCRHTAGQQAIQLQFDGPATPMMTKGNLQLIKQVWLNIFMNATQAMEEGGTLFVEAIDYEETDPLILEKLSQQLQGQRKSQRLIKVSFKDTGRGMNAQTCKRLFDPFFTTREQGTGLGMSIALKTMASHGGAIEVTSAPGKGTLIELLFPQLQEEG